MSRHVDEEEVQHLLAMLSTESEFTMWYLHFPTDIKSPFTSLKRIIIHADDDEATPTPHPTPATLTLTLIWHRHHNDTCNHDRPGTVK